MWAEAAKEPAGDRHNGSLCRLLGLSPCSTVKGLMLVMHSKRSAMTGHHIHKAVVLRSTGAIASLRTQGSPTNHQQDTETEHRHGHEKPELPRYLYGGNSVVVVGGEVQRAASTQPSLPQLDT